MATWFITPVLWCLLTKLNIGILILPVFVYTNFKIYSTTVLTPPYLGTVPGWAQLYSCTKFSTAVQYLVLNLVQYSNTSLGAKFSMHLPGENIPKMFIERWNFSSENEWKTHPLGWRCGTLRCVRGVAKSYHPPRGGECNHPPRGGAQRWAEGPQKAQKGSGKGSE